MIRKGLLAVVLVLLWGCSAVTGLMDVLPKDEGVTVQLGKENTKATIAAKVDASDDTQVGDVTGDSAIAGDTVTNDPKTMIGLVLAGMFFPMLLLFYLMPSPKWVERRYTGGNARTDKQGSG